MCSGPIVWVFGVEIDEITAPHVDRADAKSHAVGVDTVEIDQLFERRLERAGIVGAGGLNGSGRMQPGRWKSRGEEAGRATHQSEIGAHLVQPLPHGIASLPETRAHSNHNHGLAVTRSQNARSLSTRASGALPAISAPLMAPIEMPAIQSG